MFSRRHLDLARPKYILEYSTAVVRVHEDAPSFRGMLPEQHVPPCARRLRNWYIMIIGIDTYRGHTLLLHTTTASHKQSTDHKQRGGLFSLSSRTISFANRVQETSYPRQLRHVIVVVFQHQP